MAQSKIIAFPLRPNAPSQSQSLVDWYLKSLRTQPLQTKAVTCAILNTFSDLISKKIQGKDKIDKSSAAKQFLLGLLFRGPVLHFWFAFAEHVFRRWKPGMKTVLAKILMESIVFAPTFNLVNIIMIGKADGLSNKQVLRMIQLRYFLVMRAHYSVWPLAGLINYTFFPPALRVLFVNLLSVFWTAWLLSRTSTKETKSSITEEQKNN